MREQQQSRAAVRDAFEALVDVHGKSLRPQHVVDAARPAESPLHAHFEWRDDIAAERYRIEQAKGLIRVHVTVSTRPVEIARVRPSAPPPRVEPVRYQPLRSVPENGGSMSDAIKELKGFRDRFAGTRELSAVFLEIERLANPRAIGTTMVAEAVSCALVLERNGISRQEAAARAALCFNRSKMEILEALRKVG